MPSARNKVYALTGGGFVRLFRGTPKRLAVGLAAVLLGIILSGGALAASLTEVSHFGSNPGNLRMFKYIPDNGQSSRPLVVALHGCRQSASAYDDETGWTEFADRWGFALLLPQQRESNNRSSCFNWFQLGDITRDQGEALSIMQMIEQMKAGHDLDADRVYVTGLSAGGAMTSVMLAAYPEFFDGGAIIAGLPYRCATSVLDAFGCMYEGKNLSPTEWGARVRDASGHMGVWPKVSIWHGTSDTTVLPMNATELMEQWTHVHGIDQVPEEEETVKGYPRRIYKDPDGNALVETYFISGMQHGTPIDPGAAEDQCGKSAPFILDAGICSSYHIARFWGLHVTDREAPQVSITAPADGAEVSDIVTITVHASDNREVTKVEFHIDGELRRTDTPPPWEMAWDTRQEVRGMHTLTAKAFDAANNVGTSEPISVTGGDIDDPDSPTVDLVSPRDGAVVKGTITLAAEASDEASGVQNVEFFVDDTAIGTGQPSAETGPWELEWDTNSVSEGTHRLSAKAIDEAGNIAIDDDTEVMVERAVSAFRETFSDEDGDGDLFDRAEWRSGGWEEGSDNHTPSQTDSRSVFGYASSGGKCATGRSAKSLSRPIALAGNPRLSYVRKLDLHASVNIFTPATFRVLVNGEVVDQESVTGADYGETSWTERNGIDLSAFANQTATVSFEVAAESSVCIEAFAKAWVDDVVIETAD